MNIHFVETNADIRFLVESDDGHVAGFTDYEFFRWEGYGELKKAVTAYNDGEIDADGIAAAARNFWDANWEFACNGREIWEAATANDPVGYPHPTLSDEIDNTCTILSSFQIDLDFNYSEYMTEDE